MKRLKMSISQSTRKCTSIILSLVMVISLFSFSMITTNATSDTATKTVNVNDATKAIDVEGLVTDKTATANADGTFTLNLEAYATGKVTTGKAQPIDFILVLDQSGSMEDKLDRIEYSKEKKTQWKYNDIPAPDGKNPKYFKDQNGQYHLVEKYYDGNKYCLYYIENGKVHYFSDKVSNSSAIIYSGELYTVTITKPSKQDELKKAVENFANIVQNNAVTQGVDHKMAMVGFASGKHTSTNQYNTGILTTSNYETKAYQYANNVDYKNALVDVNINGNVNPIISKEKSHLWDTEGAIQRIKADGATDTQSGMEMAQKIIEQNNNGRKKVVIMFTDGMPGTGDSVSTTIANGTIESAYECKTKYDASIYTIGLFTAKESSKDAVNKFMNFTSSNYPNAISMSYPGSKESSDYYAEVTDGDALTKVFGDIAQDSAAPSIDLNEKAILQDVLSDEFVLTSDGVDSVKVYTADYNGNSEFGQRTEFTDAKIAINDKKIQVSGFDYAKNFCVDGQGEIKTSGKKLIVEIKVKRNQTTYGGNGIPTNTIASAIYDGDKKTAVETFPIPTVNLDIRYDITTKNKSIYLGESVNVNELIELPTHNINYVPDGNNNRNVDITYELIDKDRNIIATKEIKAGMSLKGDLFTEELYSLDNKVLNWMILVTSVNEESKVNKSTGAMVIGKDSKVYVFTPVIQAKDQTIFYGETAEPLASGLSVEDWVCKGNMNAPKPTSEKPNVSYELKQVNGESIPDNLTLEDTLNVKIDKVKLNDKAVDSQYVEIKNDNCELDDHAEGRDFTIHVVKGQIEINKNITAQYSNESKINSYQTFIYKIERRDVKDGDIVETFYQTLSFDATKTDKEAKAIISNLKKGYYTVTEEENWSKKYTLTSTTDNYQSLNGEEGAGKDLPIGLRDDHTGYYGLDQECYKAKGFKGNKAQVTFKNDLKSWAGWYSDAAGSKNTFNK